jgi:DNA-binding beta-propeller fold protein YncE
VVIVPVIIAITIANAIALAKISEDFKEFQKEVLSRLNEQPQLIIDQLPDILNTHLATRSADSSKFYKAIEKIDKDSLMYGHLKKRFNINRYDLLSPHIGITKNPIAYSGIPGPKLNELKKMNQPQDIAVRENMYVLATKGEQKDCFIYIHSSLNHSIRTSPQCRGVAITPDGGSILVTDNDHISIYEVNSDSKTTVNNFTKDGQSMYFDKLHGIAINPILKQIFVADIGSNQIHILNDDFLYNSSFGENGDGKGKFMAPTHIAFDKDGFVYVTDAKRHQVLKFGLNEDHWKFMIEFGSDKSVPCQLATPKGIAIDSYRAVYVSNNNGIAIFDTNGNFIHCMDSMHIGLKYAPFPPTIAVDGDDNIIVPDNSRFIFF